MYIMERHRGVPFILILTKKIYLMTSNELRELVKSHFNLVEADAEVNVTEIEETFSEETTEEVVEESWARS